MNQIEKLKIGVSDHDCEGAIIDLQEKVNEIIEVLNEMNEPKILSPYKTEEFVPYKSLKK